jgi:hypothetical protein
VSSLAAAGSPAPVEGRDFSATAASEERSVSARLTGTADLTVRQALEDFMAKLHETALASKVAEVVMDFRSLKFMNSSCLKLFVNWICTVQKLPQERRYHVVLVSSRELQWQRRSLRALWCLAEELVTLKT